MHMRSLRHIQITICKIPNDTDYGMLDRSTTCNTELAEVELTRVLDKPNAEREQSLRALLTRVLIRS